MAELVSYLTLTPDTADVTTASAEVVAAKADRQYLLLQNDSDTAIYIRFGGAAAVGETIRLNANGGSYEATQGSDNLDSRAVQAIHGGTGTKRLIVTEG